MKQRPEYNLSATGKNLRRLRKERRLTVEDVRRYMKFSSVQAVYKWELGHCFPSADNLLALAELYEVSPAELLVKERSFEEESIREGFVFLYLQGADYLVYI